MKFVEFRRKRDRITQTTHDYDRVVAISMGETQLSKQKESLDANDRNSKKTTIKMQKRICTRNSTNRSIQISLIFHRWYGNLSLQMILCVFRIFFLNLWPNAWIWIWLNIQQTQKLHIHTALLLQCSSFQLWNHHWLSVNDVSNEILPDSITKIRPPDISRLFNLSIMCTVSLSLSVFLTPSIAFTFLINWLMKIQFVYQDFL